MPQKNKQNQREILKELEVIYDNRFKWVQAGKKLREGFSEALVENLKMSKLLKICIVANVGIWLSFLLITYHIFGL